MANSNFLQLPGLWIQDPDSEWAFSIAYLLGFVVNQYNEATVACSLFTQLPGFDTSESQRSSIGQRTEQNTILLFMYAKSFVYALDAARAFLSILADQPRIPEEAELAIQDFLTDYGHIRDIRNSLQHIEERARGIGSHEREITSAILDLGSFIDHRFGITAGNSHRVDIEISHDVLTRIRNIFERVIWSFSWLGPGENPIVSQSNSSA